MKQYLPYLSLFAVFLLGVSFAVNDFLLRRYASRLEDLLVVMESREKGTSRLHKGDCYDLWIDTRGTLHYEMHDCKCEECKCLPNDCQCQGELIGKQSEAMDAVGKALTEPYPTD